MLSAAKHLGPGLGRQGPWLHSGWQAESVRELVDRTREREGHSILQDFFASLSMTRWSFLLDEMLASSHAGHQVCALPEMTHQDLLR